MRVRLSVLVFMAVGTLLLCLLFVSVGGLGTRDAVLSPESFILVAAYIVLLGAVLVRSRGWVRALMLLAVPPLAAQYVFRMVLLAQNPENYAFRYISPVFASDMVAPWAYVLLGTIALYVGTTIGDKLAGEKTAVSKGESKLGRLLSLRPVAAQLIVLNLVVLAANFALELSFGSAVIQSRPSDYSWLLRLLPVDVSLFLALFLWENYKNDLCRAEKLGILAFIVGWAMLKTYMGVRATLMDAAVVWLVVRVAREKDPALSVRWIIAGLLTVVLFPFFFKPLGIAIRDMWYWGGQFDFSTLQDYFQYNGLDPITDFSLHFTGIDRLVVLMSQPIDYSQYITAGGVLDSFVSSLTPFYHGISLPLSRIFPLIFLPGYNPATMDHSENWGFFGVPYGGLGWNGWLVVLLTGVLAGYVTRALSGSSEHRSLWRAWFMFCMFGIFMSGYMEGAVGVDIQQTIAIAFFILVCRALVHMGQQVTGRGKASAIMWPAVHRPEG